MFIATHAFSNCTQRPLCNNGYFLRREGRPFNFLLLNQRCVADIDAQRGDATKTVTAVVETVHLLGGLINFKCLLTLFLFSRRKLRRST